MKKIQQTTILLLFIFCICLSSKAQMNVRWADTLNHLLTKSRIDEGMKGLAAGVVFSDGSVWSAADGYHGNTTLSKDYLYDIGSNTKSMVSTIILQMEEEGKLSIDDTLYKYLSPIQHVSNGITLKQLLSHRSGVFSYTNHTNFSPEINTNDTKFWHPDSILTNFLSPANFSPGSSFKYSNTGYLLLGQVAEAIDNKPLNQILSDRIFNPIGLDSTFLDQYDSYNLIKTGAWLSSTNYYSDDFISFMSCAWAAGGVVSTPSDFARYAHELFSGQLFSAASLQKMQVGTSIGGGGVYGLGAIKWYYRGRYYLGHGGTTLQNSEMEYSLSSNFSLVLMNIDLGFGTETARTKLKFINLLEYIEDQEASIGLDDNLLPDIEVNAFPNPSSDFINIEVKTENLNSSLVLEIRDISGRMVKEVALENNKAQLRKEEIGKGVYIASIYKNKQWIANKKVVFN